MGGYGHRQSSPPFVMLGLLGDVYIMVYSDGGGMVTDKVVLPLRCSAYVRMYTLWYTVMRVVWSQTK